MALAKAIKFSGSCGSRLYAEILKNPPKMFFHRARTNCEDCSNVLITLASSKPLQDFCFSLCQTMCACRCRSRTLIQEEPQSFIVFDKAHEEKCSLSPLNQEFVAQLRGR
jgi:hypothetical protein